MSRPLIIYHAPCADGFGGALAAWLRFHDQAEYLGISHHHGAPDVTGRDIYLIDFAFTRSCVEQLVVRGNQVTVLDHHESSVTELMPLLDAGIIKGVLETGRSGSVLAWHWFHSGEPLPLLFQHIEDQDLKRNRLKNTREIVEGLRLLPMSFSTWRTYMHDVEGLRRTGSIALATIHRLVNELAAHAFMANIGGYTVPVVNAPEYLASDIGERLADGHPFAAVYTDIPEGRKFLLESGPNGINVIEVAAMYGGGGHPNGAGFFVVRHPHDRRSLVGAAL